MKKCNTEIMKDLKTLEESKNELLNYEKENCTHSYCKGEEPIINGYDYAAVKQKLETINKRVRYLKGLLAQSNVTTIVEGFDMSIGEALIYLAQLSAEKERLKELANKQALTRSKNGWHRDEGVEFTEVEYDIKAAQADYWAVSDRIYKLQLAIDRTNLNHMIEVED